MSGLDFDTSVYSLIQKKYPNISFFILNLNNYFIEPSNFHKDDIIIYTNSQNSRFPIKNVKPDIILKDLSKRLIEDESLYENGNYSHAQSEECIKIVANELLKTIDSIYENKQILQEKHNEIDFEMKFQKHHLITNLNIKYCYQKYINETVCFI